MKNPVKHIAKRVMKAYGYEVRCTGEFTPRAHGIRHAEVFPLATYSPWLADEEFRRVYESIKKHTLVDQYRCYELWQLVSEVAKLPTGDVIEIGVWRGGTGALIAEKCRLDRIENTVYLCDTFRGVVKAGPKDTAYVGGEHADTAREVVTALCDSLGLDRVRILEGIFPDDSGALVSDRRFRLCHIDVDVYESARDIARWIWQRLVPGGVIVYDDFGFYNCAGITQFVNEERARPDRMVLHNLNGHALVLKICGGSN